MKKTRGFKLGRRLVKVWRHIFRRQRRKHYMRLNARTSNSSNSQPPRPVSKPSNPTTSKPATKAVTTKLFNLSRMLTRPLQRRHKPKTDVKQQLLGPLDCEKPPPKGYLAVYVGEDLSRVLVPVLYFNHPLFKELLRAAEKEFGYRHPGGITIPCAAAEFEKVKKRIEAGDERCRRLEEGFCSFQHRAVFL